jgi:pyruvate kinase
MKFSKTACLAITFSTANAFVANRQPSNVAFSRTLPLASMVEDATDKVSNTMASSEVKAPTVAAVPKLAQRWRKSTKQLATLGPASSSFEMIEKLFLAGADVFRLNFSHGAQEQKKDLLETIRKIEDKYSHPIAVLGDLQGPKLRVGEFSKTVCST